MGAHDGRLLYKEHRINRETIQFGKRPVGHKTPTLNSFRETQNGYNVQCSQQNGEFVNGVPQKSAPHTQNLG